MVAGLATTRNFAKPGSVKILLFLSSLWPTSTRDSRTALTCLRETSSPTDSVIAVMSPFLLSAFLEPLAAAFFVAMVQSSEAHAGRLAPR